MRLIQELRKLYHIVKWRAASWRAGLLPGRHGCARRSRCHGRWLALLGVKGLVVGLSASLLAGCAGLQLPGLDNGNPEKSYARQLGDMPLPRGARIIGEGTLILGSGPDWTGRLAIVTDLGGVEAFAFFRDQYPNQGWQLISSMQARNSILVFVKGERTATVEISAASLFGSKSNVLMTVAPKADDDKLKKPK